VYSANMKGDGTVPCGDHRFIQHTAQSDILWSACEVVSHPGDGGGVDPQHPQLLTQQQWLDGVKCTGGVKETPAPSRCD